MAAFPALKPNTRVFVAGDVPRNLNVSLAGNTTGFRRGNRRVNQTLEMSFICLTETQMNLIKDHFFNSNGTYNLFYLSAEVWSDYTTPPIPLLSDYAWRYLNTPTVTDEGVNRFTVEVSLQTAPIDTGDLVFDAGLAGTSPARTYTLDGGAAAAVPARGYIISPGGAL